MGGLFSGALQGYLRRKLGVWIMGHGSCTASPECGTAPDFVNGDHLDSAFRKLSRPIHVFYGVWCLRR